MKNLQDRVNLVPVIGKADGLTKKEVEKLKSQVIAIRFFFLLLIISLSLRTCC